MAKSIMWSVSCAHDVTNYVALQKYSRRGKTRHFNIINPISCSQVLLNQGIMPTLGPGLRLQRDSVGPANPTKRISCAG